MRPILLTIPFILFHFLTFGQDTTYFDFQWRVVPTLNDATFYIISKQVNEPPVVLRDVTYFKSGQIKEEKSFADVDRTQAVGKIKEWNLNGNLLKEIDISPQGLHGQFNTYWRNGKLRRADLYENDVFISGKCYNDQGQEIPHFPYYVEPSFPGGLTKMYKFLAQTIEYPSEGSRNNLKGRVVVQFTVDREGKLENFEIAESSNKIFDNEALRVVKKMPNWEPGRQDGVSVKTRYTLPINFIVN